MKRKKKSTTVLILALFLALTGHAHIISATAQTLGAPVEQGAEEAFPGRTGEPGMAVFETPWGFEVLEYQVIDGQPVFEGDILLPAEGEHPDPETDSLILQSAGVSVLGRRWPYGIVPVENTGLAQDPRVTQAIAHWQARTSLRFVIGATSGNRVRFVAAAANECSSFIGMTGGGPQPVNLGANCGVGQAIHEIGHAIGLFHEQSRTDRNFFVRVHDGTGGTLNCIQPGLEDNFDMFGAEGVNLGAYDLGSIMHYGSTFFLNTSMPGCFATITRLDGTLITPNRSALSGGDIIGAQSLYLAGTNVRQAVDYDFDGKTDLAVWRPSTGLWYVINSRTGQASVRQWGIPTDIPVPADYDGDGRTDLAVWRPSTGLWYVISSSTGQVSVRQWGVPTDIPVPADYDGDGRTDLAVWRPSTGFWYVISSSTGQASVRQWGVPRDVLIPADYDGDGRTDLAVWRPSTGFWYVISSSTGQASVRQWGVPTDIPVPADYDGDGRTDLAVWRPSTGLWYVISSSTGQASVRQWGIVGDRPIPGDYDGDGRTDLAVWRPSTGLWYVISSSTGQASVRQWGIVGDIPVP